MHKHTTRTKHGHGVLRSDLQKIKAILATTARDMRGEARHAIAESYENVKDKTVDIRENVSDYVGSKPYKALAIALFSGLAFGLAMRKKRTHRNSRR